MNPEIYVYDDYRAFIRAWQDQRPGRTQRWLAGSLGCSPALVSSFINPQARHPRALSAALIGPLCDLMGLDGRRAAYFRDLVARHHARTEAEREAAFERLLAARDFAGARTMTDDGYRLLSRWWYLAILELASCPGFDDDPGAVAACLRPRVAVSEVAEALAVLKRIGQLTKGEDGRWRPSAVLMVDNQDAGRDLRDQATRSLHRWMLRRVVEVIDSAPREERMLNGITFAIDRRRLPEVRRRVEECLVGILSFAEAGADSKDCVQQLQVQLFPLAWVGPAAAGGDGPGEG